MPRKAGLELREQRNVDLRFDWAAEIGANIKRCAVELALERLFCADPEHPTAEERKVIVASASKWMDEREQALPPLGGRDAST